MIIQNGDITFRRLRHEDIELVRNWRNSPEVKNYMEYQGYISPEMQEKWFKSVDNIYNLYFIIEYKGDKLGVINGKDIDWENRTMETGIFIANQKYINSPVPLFAVLTFGELGVVKLEIKATAHILKDNSRAKKYNKMIGFELQEGQEDVYNQFYVMTKESYLKRSKLLTKALNTLMGNHKIVITFEKHDLENGFADFLIKEFDNGQIKKTENFPDKKILYY